jgi:hypothetical protein
MPKEPKATLSLNSGSFGKREGAPGKRQKKSQEAYQGFNPLQPSWPNYLCLFFRYIGRNFVLRVLLVSLLLRPIEIVKVKIHRKIHGWDFVL